MGCCLNPIAPTSQPNLDFASLEERNIGLHQIPLEQFISTLRATSITDTITPNNLKTVFTDGRWKDALSSDSMAIFILTHPSLLTEDQKVHKHSIVALGLLYAKASPNIRANIFLLEVQNQDTLKSMAQRLLTIAARVVPLYLQNKQKEVDKLASQEEIGLVLHDFMDEALGSYKSYSYKWLSQFMIRLGGGYILSPERIREKFSVKYFNELVGTRGDEEKGDTEEADDQKGQKEEDKQSEKKSDKTQEEKNKEKVESTGKPEEEKKVESDSDEEGDEGEDIEMEDTGVVKFDLIQLKKEKIPRSKCAFNAYIEHQFDQKNCCDITHTIGFSYLEKLVRLAKYAWKRSQHYWQPLGTIMEKYVAMIEVENGAKENMENLHNFVNRYYKSSELDHIFTQCKEKGSYGDYVEWLKSKFQEVETAKEKNKLALIAIKALNNYPGNLRSACSETNRNVIRKHVDLPYEGNQIGGASFVYYFVECCAALKDLIPEASEYIRKNILEKAFNPVVSEDHTCIISSKECVQEQGHSKELKSEYFIPQELFIEMVKKIEEKYGESLDIQGLGELKKEEEEEKQEEQEESHHSESEPKEEEEKEESQHSEEPKEEKEDEDKQESDHSELGSKEGEEENEKSELGEVIGIQEEKVKEDQEIQFDLATFKGEKIPRSKCAFNAYIEHQFDKQTCCDITHTIGFSYLEKLVRLAKYAWKERLHQWQPMGIILTKHITLITKEPDTEERMENLHNFLDNHWKEQEFKEVFDKSKEENDSTAYSAYVESLLQNVNAAEEVDEIAIIAIKALNNYAGNLRSACSETNRNVIRKHVDLPYDGEEIGGVKFIEYFLDCCATMKSLIPSASEYIKNRIVQKALNGVLSEDQTTIISSKWCELEQGHDKELKSENFIPGKLYRDLIKKAEEIYGEGLEIEALGDLKEEAKEEDEVEDE